MENIHLEFGAATIRVTGVDTGNDIELINLWDTSYADSFNIDEAFNPVTYIPAIEQHVVIVHTSDGLKREWDVRKIDDGTTYPTTADLITAIKAAIDALSGGGGGGVASVSATAPITSTGGANPVIASSNSTGGNEATDSGKLVKFAATGGITGSSATTTGVLGTSTNSGIGVKGTSTNGFAVWGESVNTSGGVFKTTGSGGAEPALVVQSGDTMNSAPIAQFGNDDDVQLTIGNDGRLDWTGSATGAAATVVNLGVLATTIVDGDTTHAPDGNAVFDALALKVSTVVPLRMENYTAPSSGGVITINASAEFSAVSNVFISSSENGIKFMFGKFDPTTVAAVTYLIYDETGSPIGDLSFTVTIIGTSA